MLALNVEESYYAFKNTTKGSKAEKEHPIYIKRLPYKKAACDWANTQEERLKDFTRRKAQATYTEALPEIKTALEADFESDTGIIPIEYDEIPGYMN